MSAGPWVVIWHDTDKIIERRTIGKDADGAVYEERTTWTNPDAVEVRLAAVEAAVEAKP
jgi:hypothetical protein